MIETPPLLLQQTLATGEAPESPRGPFKSSVSALYEGTYAPEVKAILCHVNPIARLSANNGGIFETTIVNFESKPLSLEISHKSRQIRPKNICLTYTLLRLVYLLTAKSSKLSK